MKLNYFKFEIKPFIEGYGVILEISTQVDGKEYHIKKYADDSFPWETQLEYYTRLAVMRLQESIQEELEGYVNENTN